MAYNSRYIQNQQPDKKSRLLYTYRIGDGCINRSALRIKRKIDGQGKGHGSRHGALGGDGMWGCSRKEKH